MGQSKITVLLDKPDIKGIVPQLKKKKCNTLTIFVCVCLFMKVIHIRDDMRVSKWWENFGWTIPLIECAENNCNKYENAFQTLKA